MYIIHCLHVAVKEVSVTRLGSVDTSVLPVTDSKLVPFLSLFLIFYGKHRPCLWVPRNWSGPIDLRVFCL